MRALIIGGVAGGATAAARLRRLSEEAEIVVVERGEHIAYANCGLPYHVGGAIANRASLLLLTPDTFRRRFNVEVRTGHEALAIDRDTKTVAIRQRETGAVYREGYDFLLLAPGASPLIPRRLAGARVFTLRTIADADRLQAFLAAVRPRSAAVIGGGFLGLEMVESLSRRGLEVTLVEMATQVLLGLDPDLAAIVQEHLANRGIRLELGCPVASIEDDDRAAGITLEDGRRLEAELVILALGVRPEVDLAREAGLELGPLGGIAVDERLRTSDPSIFAVGDAVEMRSLVSGQPALLPLAGPANRQARVAASNMAGRDDRYEGGQGTAIVKVFDLAAAFTGLNLRQLEHAGIDHLSCIVHSTHHAAYYPGAQPLTLKLIFSPSGVILGAQAVGREGVDKRIDVISTALRLGGKVPDLGRLELTYAPPFGSARDPVNVAGLMAGNILAGDVRMVTAAGLLADPGRQVVDVSEPAEFRAGHPAGAVNIPLGELRGRLDELDREREVVVTCRVGRRSYNASRLLSQRGFKTCSLDGGYQTYRAVAGIRSGPEHDLDACGLACPGPILAVQRCLDGLPPGAMLRVQATDPGFPADITAWCERTGHHLVESKRQGDRFVAIIGKGNSRPAAGPASGSGDKTIILFSGDLDRAMAAFIIANGAAAMGRQVTVFFTFWGLNVLRRRARGITKPIMDRMFGAMMPRGPSKLGLSRMNMLGIGPRLIRRVMRQKGVMPLEELMDQAVRAGVRLVACQMSMDVMGISREELRDGVEVGGVAAYLQASEKAGMNLFI